MSDISQVNNANPFPVVLDYFGTNLDCAGHFFWQLKGNSISRSGVSFDKLPFNPENLLPKGIPKGTVKYFRIEKYAIVAIEGSCGDKRPGTTSVFWTDQEVKLGQMKSIILSIPIAKRIIDSLPFEVAWNTQDVKNLNVSDGVTLQEVMEEFYDEHESYIDANAHGVVVRLIKALKDNELLLGGDWNHVS